MKFLCIDTSTAACSVAVYDQGRTACMHETRPQVHSDRVLSMCDELLKNQNLSLEELDAIAVTRGPGSFTGVRIGISVAQGIGFSTGKKIASISTLALLAQALHLENNSHNVYCIADARMNEVYHGGFVCDQGVMQNIGGEHIGLANEIVLPSGYDWISTGSGWLEYPQQLLNVRQQTSSVFENNESTAESMIPLVIRHIEDDQLISPEMLEPVYLRNNVVHKKTHA